MVERLFATWEAVPTATIGFARTGTAAVDVDVTNFGPFLGPYGGATTPSGRTTIVFDADGAIFDTLFGVGTGVLGFAGPTFIATATTTVPIGEPISPGARSCPASSRMRTRMPLTARPTVPGRSSQ